MSQPPRRTVCTSHLVTRLQQSTHSKRCSGAVNLAVTVSVVYQQKTILSHSTFFERVGVCQSLQAWDPMLGFCPTYRTVRQHLLQC